MIKHSTFTLQLYFPLPGQLGCSIIACNCHSSREERREKQGIILFHAFWAFLLFPEQLILHGVIGKSSLYFQISLKIVKIALKFWQLLKTYINLANC